MPCFRGLALLVAALVLAPATGTRGEMAAEEQVVGGVGSDEERRRLEAALEAERQAAAVREANAAAEAERRRAQKILEREARPYPLRLTEQRCTGCHGLEDFAQARHGWLGWQLVILRMQWFNGARLDPGERGVIAAHLARTQGASAARSALETLIAGAVAALLASIVCFAVNRFRRR